jgi:LTXXQ motif family protein
LNGTKSAITVLLAAVAMIAPSAFAQYPGGRGGGPGAGSRGGMGGGQAAQGPGKTRDRPAADTLSATGAPVLVQLDQLEDDLKLTPQQRAVWNAYADKVLRLADDMTRNQFAARTSTQLTEGTAVQQLDGLAGSARNRLTAVDEIVEAGKALYATLTSEQKTIADRRLVLPMLSLASSSSPPGMSRTSPIN